MEHLAPMCVSRPWDVGKRGKTWGRNVKAMQCTALTILKVRKSPTTKDAKNRNYARSSGSSSSPINVLGGFLRVHSVPLILKHSEWHFGRGEILRRAWHSTQLGCSEFKKRSLQTAGSALNIRSSNCCKIGYGSCACKKKTFPLSHPAI